MSRLHSQTFPCAGCGATLELGIVSSINADRRPDLRQAVLDDSYQRGRCEACGKPYRVEPELTYLDAAGGQWILVRPARHLSEWAPMEEIAQNAFERAHGEQAPPDAREIGRHMRPRITFGWAGFREKLICAEHGLDDVTLELTKLALMRSLDDMPLADDMELRLTAATADELELTWGLSTGDLGLEEIAAPRALYDEIAADAAGAWVELRAELAAASYVDVNRMLVPADDQA